MDGMIAVKVISSIQKSSDKEELTLLRTLYKFGMGVKSVHLNNLTSGEFAPSLTSTSIQNTYF